jgi:ferredoxin-nitrite reductase
MTALKPAPDWELVYKRNPVERIKRDRSPLGILDELPALIAAGYERVAEEDIVRLKWWGLYHDKPKIGTFMLRIKLPGGRVSPEGLRAIGEISNEFGRGDGELSTRQNVQLHWLELGSLPRSSTGSRRRPHLRRRVRRRGPQHHGLPGRRASTRTSSSTPSRSSTRRPSSSTATPTTRTCRASTRSRSPPARTTATRPRSTASRSSAPCTKGVEGFGVRVGGGLSSVPRIARDLGVFVPKGGAVEVLRALLDAWQEDTRYRISRVKARMKFMVDDYGPDGMRAEVERRLGPAAGRLRRAVPDTLGDHIGVHPQKQPGSLRRRPVHLGSPPATRCSPSPDLAERSAATFA